MKLTRRRLVSLAAGAAALPVVSEIARAQVYPSRPVTIIVPVPPGGVADPIARILADHLTVTLGQPVVVENVTGAGGSIGVGRAARAAPDGYTLSIGNWLSHVGASAVYPVQYDVLKDFKAVWLLPTARFAQPSQHGRRAARHVLCWSGWRHSEGPANASIQNISGLPQGLAGRPAAGWRCGRLSARASRRRNA